MCVSLNLGCAHVFESFVHYEPPTHSLISPTRHNVPPVPFTFGVIGRTVIKCRRIAISEKLNRCVFCHTEMIESKQKVEEVEDRKREKETMREGE